MGAIKDLVDKRDYKAALSEIKKIDVENSMNPQFMVLCGRVYAENKKFDEARKTLISAHILAPKSEQVIEEIIRLYLKIGYFTKAKQYFKIYTTIVPMESIEGQRVLYNVKKALSASDDELIGILQGILNKEYIDELAFELALLYRKAGRNEDSIKECDKIFSSFAQSNLYVKWAKPLKMGSINVNKAFNCYPKDEVPEQSGNIYQYVQKENEQLKKDFIEVEGGNVADATAPEEDDSVIVENIDDDDAISVDAEVTETATVVGGSKNAYVHKPDEEVEVEIIEEGSSDEDEPESDTLMLEEDTEAARQRDEEGSEIEDIKAALDKIARAERRKEEAMEAAKKEQQSEEPQAEESKPEEPQSEEPQPEEPQPEESQSEEQVVEEQPEEVELTEPEPVAEVEEPAEEPEPVPEEAPTEEVEAEVPEQEVASDEAPPESNDDAQGYDYDEEEAFDMADDNKPKLSLKLAGGGGGGRGGAGSNRSSFGGGGMRSGMGGQILSKEEREFMANYDDSKLQQREAAAKERAKRAKQAMAAEEEKRIAAEKRAEMEREQAEARARAEAEKKAAEDAQRAEEEAKVAEARAQAEAVARAEAEAEAAKRAEAEARAKAESDAKVAEERRIQQEREKALEDARAKQILEQRQAEEEARRKAEEAKRAEEEAKKAEEERKIKEEEERAAKALAEQERLRNSVSRARSKADQEREDAIAAIRAKVEAERAAKEEKKRKAQEQLDEQERRRIKKLPPFKRKSISKEVLDRLGLAIDEKGELIDPPPKQEEAPAAEAQTQETQEAATAEAQTDESANQEDAPKADLSTAEPQAPQDGVNEAEPDENRPETIEVNAGREAEETDNVEVNAGREAEPTDNIEVNAGREAEATDNIEVNATREPEAEGVKVEDDGVTLGNVALAGGSLSDAGLGGESINRDGHSEVTLDNAAFAGDKLVTDETFEEEQRLKAEEEAKRAEEEAKIQAEQQAEAEPEPQPEPEPEPQPEPEPEQAEEEIEEEVEVEAVEEETEVEVVEDSQSEEVEAEPQPEVIELGTEPEVDSDVVEVKDEADEEPVEEPEAEQEESAAEPEEVEEEIGESMVIDGIEIDKYGVPVKAEKHVAKYAASVGFRKQFRKNIEQVIEKKGIYRNLVVLAGEGAKVSNVAIDYARAYHDIGLVKTKVVATIKASVLNKTDLNKILSKLKGGCLVIEQAGDISSEKAEQVYEIVNNPDNDVVLMLVGEADSVKDMFKESPDLNSLFHSILLLHNLSDKDLADMAVAFMQQNGFKPDEEGLKVLNDKIDSMDAKGIDEIISFVGNALNRAEQRAKDTLGDVVFNGDLEDGGLNTVKAMDFE